MLLAGALLPGAAGALSVDGRSQIHAVIGQPLAVAVPVSFAGVNPSTVTVRVVPGPDLPDEEEMVAASVQASYDAERSVVRLSTPRRLTVPALGLHLVVSAGSLVVNQDIDVLVDVPDLDSRHTAQADAAAADAQTQGTAIRVLTVEKPAAQGRLYGDASARGGAGDDERPSVTPPPPPPPPDPRPRTWQVKQGETLSSISHSLAAVYHVPFEAMTLALYEGNSEAFSAKAPEQALAGKRLQVPEDFVVQGEPPSRVAQFRAWLRRPDQPWKLRAFPSLLPDPAPHGAPDGALPPWRMAQSVAIVAGAAVLLLATLLLLRRLRLRRLMTRYVPMSAVHAKRIKRIIIPTPPPRRGLSQGAVTEKLRIKRLREMLDHNPFRSDIRYRLAERLHKAGDGRTFGQIAPPLRPSLSPEAWARICKMGQELLPGDPRFQG